MKTAWMAGAALAAMVAGAHAAPQRDEKVYAAVTANKAGAVDLLKQIVNVDSGTGDVAGGAKVAGILSARLKALGAEVRNEKSEAPDLPDNVVAVFHGTGKGKILVIAHFDTVFGPGTVKGRPFSIDANNRAHGPGVGDEKAGDVVALTALKILHDLNFKDYASITVLLDASEERGSPSCANLIKKLAAENDVEFNMEPGDAPDVLTVWRKGAGDIVIHVEGRAAHAGMVPQNGRNAAMELTHQINALGNAFPTSGDGVTANLTLMKAGSRANIIPDSAEATLDVRFRKPDELQQVIARVKANAAKTAVPDTKVTVTASGSFPPLVENAQTHALALRTDAIYAELGKKIGHGGNGGASESAVAQSVGTPALDGLGAVGGDFHTDHEWIDLNTLEPRVYLFTRLLMETGARPPGK
ncbi:MAG TPA: glutamate carboxypeptidase [Rhizomicrobium sp.]|jgi:glutamate carboxypeptidase|nr:glutamate carboxypeptidase [Rhizomicrobium sp.]